MIKKFLTRYNFNYPRSLVYMLQSCEYGVKNYLAWYHRMDDFSQVEQRKKLDLTVRAKITLIATLFVYFSLIILSFLLIFNLSILYKIITLVCAIILIPHITAYSVAFFSMIIELSIKKPIEFLIAKKTEKILKKSNAIKIAIAGSYGKTTMREILRTVLSEGRKVSAPSHNHNTLIGIARFVEKLNEEDILIFELGEYYPGDVKKLCKIIKPDIGIITGVNEAHLERSGSLKTTTSMIFELADFTKGVNLYLNGEDDLVVGNISQGNIIYSRFGIGEYKVNTPSTDLSGLSFSTLIKEREVTLKSELLGLHLIGPIMTALDIGLRLGLSIDEIKRGISATKPFPHRLNPKIDGSGVVIIDDTYNGNPDGVVAAIDFLSSLSGSRRFYITPGLVEMGERTEEVHREIGKRLAVANIEKIVLIKNSVTPFIEKGFKEENGRGEIIWFDDVFMLFASLPLLTAKGDVVLLQNDWSDQYQ